VLELSSIGRGLNEAQGSSQQALLPNQIWIKKSSIDCDVTDRVLGVFAREPIFPFGVSATGKKSKVFIFNRMILEERLYLDV
jgi:hypothetical protein